MKHLVIGFRGEVGSALFKIIQEADHKVTGIDKGTSTGNCSTYDADFMHICIGYSDTFVKTVIDYIATYSRVNTIVIIHSTVNPHTTSKICYHNVKVVYSPVRGKHPYLVDGIQGFPKFYAIKDQGVLTRVANMYNGLGIPHIGLLEDPISLEFAKPINTTYYGHLLSFYQDLVMICETNNLNLDTIIKFISTTGDRPVFPTINAIGGHCVVSNAKIMKDHSFVASNLLRINNAFKNRFKDKVFSLLVKNKLY